MHESVNGEGVYIATAQAYDDEMRERIGLHRQTRDASGFSWLTVEEPYELSALLRRFGGGSGGTEAGADRAVAGSLKPAEAMAPSVLVDCLTLWLSNRLLALEHDSDRDRLLHEEVEALVQAAADYTGALTLVTNEVGSGIVPEYALGRLFRDFAGRLNQRMAERAERVFLVTCGIPLELKSLQYRFE